MAPQRADVVVIGGGSCGCVVAARLSDDPDRSVLLLEAGRAYGAGHALPPELRSAAELPIGPESQWTAAYSARLTKGVDATVVRGRGLGGSGAVNGAYFVRARPGDFESWPRSWSYDEVLPHFRAIESDADFPGGVHGSDGPVPVVRTPQDRLHPASAAFHDAAVAAGHRPVADLNAPGPVGVGRVPMNVRDGVRYGPSLAYLAPVMDRPNLSVRTGAKVVRIVLSKGRATGVEVVDAASVRRIDAGHVVVCAGAVCSPQLLMLSGIGPEPRLRRLGIDVVHDLAGVGEGFSDHPEIAVPYRYRDGIPMRAPLLETVLHTETLEFRAYTVPFGVAIPGSGIADPVLGVVLTRPRSRGSVMLDPQDPSAPPVLDYRYLAHPDDRATLRDGVCTAVDLLTDMTDVVAPGSVAVDAGERGPSDAWLASHLGTSLHLSGTCRMGDDEHSVVDERCRVHGIDGLSVVDTSVFPEVPSRGPHATAVMLAHRVTAGPNRGSGHTLLL
ncbi:mycofactocin dehydrogenase MftG [Rhodococcus sp. SJ-2]